MYAIIQNGSHQHKVKAGAFLRLEKREEEPGAKGSFDKVLAFSNKEGQTTFGKPYVPGAKVKFLVIRHGKSKKKLVFKKKRRKGYRRTQGHRQEFTEIYIETLSDSAGQKTSIPLKKKTSQKDSHSLPASKAETKTTKANKPSSSKTQTSTKAQFSATKSDLKESVSETIASSKLPTKPKKEGEV